MRNAIGLSDVRKDVEDIALGARGDNSKLIIRAFTGFHRQHAILEVRAEKLRCMAFGASVLGDVLDGRKFVEAGEEAWRATKICTELVSLGTDSEG